MSQRPPARVAAVVTISLHPYSSEWPTTFEQEARRIRHALPDLAIDVHHTGSTSVPGLRAKPIIDITMGVPDSASEDAYLSKLVDAGYEFLLREPEWFEHRLFRRVDPRVNLHVFSTGSSEIERMLVFRDHLRVDAADRALYETTKLALAENEWETVQHYADSKSNVVETILSRAFAVRRQATSAPDNEPCPACGFVYDVTMAGRAGHEIVRGAAQLASIVESAGATVTNRPSPSTWSVLEYGCHVRDVLLVQRERVLLARRTEQPSLVPMGRDERVEHDGYNEQSPSDVARQLGDAAMLFAGVLARLNDDEWKRTLMYNFPAPMQRDLAWLAVHTHHEVQHHLADIRAQINEEV